MGIPPGVTEVYFEAAWQSLYALQGWLAEDPCHSVLITCAYSDLVTAALIVEYTDPQDALAWVDRMLDAARPNWYYWPDLKPKVTLVYEDTTLRPVVHPIAAKDLPGALCAVSTGSAAELQSFAEALYAWSTTGGPGFVTATCELSPPQEGFANTFSAPDLNSLTSWIASVLAYMAATPGLTATIFVTSVAGGGPIEE